MLFFQSFDVGFGLLALVALLRSQFLSDDCCAFLSFQKSGLLRFKRKLYCGLVHHVLKIITWKEMINVLGFSWFGLTCEVADLCIGRS